MLLAEAVKEGWGGQLTSFVPVGLRCVQEMEGEAEPDGVGEGEGVSDCVGVVAAVSVTSKLLGVCEAEHVGGESEGNTGSVAVAGWLRVTKALEDRESSCEGRGWL